MGVKNPKAKFPLPDEINPPGLRCFQVLIPDEPHYVAAFRGAMLAYASPISWADDPEHKAKQVGEVLAPLIATMETCEENMLDVRQKPTAPCILEKRVGGEDWETFANLQLCPPKMRINGGKLQWWNGDSWETAPDQGDERFDGEATPPWPVPPPGQSGNCLAGANIAAVLETQVLQWIDILTAGTVVLTIITVITAVLTAIAIPPATPIIVLFVDALVAVGDQGLQEAFTSAVYDKLKCIIDCRAAADGSISGDAYDNIVADVDLQTGNAWPLIKVWLSFFGPVGLTRIAKSGILTANCSDCDCEPCHFTLERLGNGTVTEDGTCDYDCHATNNDGTYRLGIHRTDGLCFKVQGLAIRAGGYNYNAWTDCDNVVHENEDPRLHCVKTLYFDDQGAGSAFVLGLLAYDCEA